MNALTYPKAVLHMNAGKDDRCSIDGLYASMDLALNLYEESDLGVEDRFHVYVDDHAAHKRSAKM